MAQYGRANRAISGGSVCADGFPVGVPFTLQWPPMAVWAHHFQCFRRAGGVDPSHDGSAASPALTISR